MAKRWKQWGKRRDSRENQTWMNREYSAHYRQEDEGAWRLLKKTLAAVLIFAVVYGIHITDTWVSRSMDDAIRYMVTTSTDFSAYTEELARYAPKGFDQTVLKRVQSTVSRPADPLLYMTKPADGKIASSFGWQVHPVLKQEMMNDGIGIEAALGTSVRAAAPGRVKAVSESAKYGKTIIVDHGQETETIYGHLGEILVKAEDSVSQGQVIARVGKTGMTAVPLLYFEVRDKGKPIDPLTRIRGTTD